MVDAGVVAAEGTDADNRDVYGISRAQVGLSSERSD